MCIRDSPYTVIFVDDILVISRTLEEHFEHLRSVFQKLRLANIKLKLHKCEFIKSQMKFLGHVISATGISTDPEKLRSICLLYTSMCIRDRVSTL